MATEGDLTSWTDLLNNSTKLLQQAAPSTQFPPIQRSLDQLEILSKRLKDRTSRIEAPSHSIAATRLLAREGINAEQLTRDLKSFELKPTFEDVFPIEAASVEEYLQQVHEMAMLSAVQEAQRDNLRSFDDYMLQVLEAALGGSTGNLQRVRAFLRVRLRDYGVLDFDAQDGRRQPPVDTTWQQHGTCPYFICSRTRRSKIDT